MKLMFALVAFSMFGGCEKPRPEEITTAPEKPKIVDAKPPASLWPTDVPPSTARCEKHEDCAVLVDAPGANPCCNHRSLRPVSRAYFDWVRRYQQEKCVGVVCPTEPLPGPEPSCCESIGRCVNHACVIGCSDPTLDAPKVDWLDAMCRMPVP